MGLTRAQSKSRKKRKKRQEKNALCAAQAMWWDYEFDGEFHKRWVARVSNPGHKLSLADKLLLQKIADPDSINLDSKYGTPSWYLDNTGLHCVR